jgi:tetratricopeptide (TPR) repeat protein
VLSLVFGLYQLTQIVSDIRDRERSTAELYQVGKQQQAAGDYPAAWASFEQGLKAAEPGGKLAKLTGQLGKERAQLRLAQEDLAVQWLQNVRVNVSRGESFFRVVDMLNPVLHRGAAGGQGARKADLLAHLGWGEFLRWREGRIELDPEPLYRQALAIDPANPYAHAYWGHWQLWTRQTAALPEARAHFRAALSAGRARELVRRIQLSAIQNLGRSGDAELLGLVNEMRRQGERIDPTTREAAWSVYRWVCEPPAPDRIAKVLAAVPLADHEATFAALFHGNDLDETRSRRRDACLAALLEAAGRRDEARQVWATLRRELPPDDREWRERADAALRRLPGPR